MKRNNLDPYLIRHIPQQEPFNWIFYFLEASIHILIIILFQNFS